MFELIIVIYTIWAIYSGWKFVTNRIPNLNQQKVSYITIKVILSVAIGYVIGSITLLIGIFTLLYSIFWKNL